MSEMLLDSVGAGAPVLFVHGLGGTPNVFGPQVGVLTKHFTCIRAELPGSGGSAAAGALALDALAEQLATQVVDAADGPVHVVGHSLGTIVCQHLAVKRPDRVRSLFLIGPILAPPDGARTALRDRAGKARAEGMTGIAEAIVQGGTSADTKAHSPVAASFVRELLMRQDPEGYALTCEALAGCAAADVERITCPTYLVTGDEDGTAPPAAVRNLASKISGSQFAVLERCGHWATLERPTEVNVALLNFLLAGKS